MHSRDWIGLFLVLWIGPVLLVNPVGDIMSDASLGTAVSIVDRHTLEIHPTQAIDVVEKDGKIYSGVGPGAALLPVPLYFVARDLIAWLPQTPDGMTPAYSFVRPHRTTKEVFLLHVLAVWLIVAPLSAWCFVQMARYASSAGYSPRAALWAAFAGGAGSLWLVYAGVYSRQLLASALVYLVFFTLLEGRLRSDVLRLLAGLIVGMAIAIDYAVVFLAALLTPFIWRESSRRGRLLFVAGAAVVGCAIGAYHQVMFGSPFTTPYSDRVWMDHHMVVQYKGETHVGSTFQTGPLLGLSHPTLSSLYGLTLSHFRGVLVYCPVLLAGAWGHVRSARAQGRALSWLAAAVFTTYLLFVASLPGELYWSGFPVFFGPRYLMPLFPMVLFGIARIEWGTRAGKIVVAGIALSMGINLLGAMFHDLMIPMLSDRLFLQTPIFHLVREVFTAGPRVPLLDRLGVSRTLQGSLVLAYLVTTAVVMHRLSRRLQNQSSSHRA